MATRDFLLPDVHLLSLYFLVKVLQERNRQIIKKSLKRVYTFPMKNNAS